MEKNRSGEKEERKKKPGACGCCDGRCCHEEEEEKPIWKLLVRFLLAGALLGVSFWADRRIPAAGVALGVAAWLILAWDVLREAGEHLVRNRWPDENFLMSVSTIAALCLGDRAEAAAVLALYHLGEWLEDRATERSHRSVTRLLDLREEVAHVLRNGTLNDVSPDEVEVGEEISVQPGGRIPLDGVVTSGHSPVDTSSLTGESAPLDRGPGDEVLAGCLNGGGQLTVRVTRPAGDSAAAKMLALIEESESHQAEPERLTRRIARVYTPVVVLLSLLLAVVPPLFFGGNWAEWIRRGATVLVISCPCALVISIPLTYFCGIGAASSRGVLLKGGGVLERLAAADTAAFDKTGTLTTGSFRLCGLEPVCGVTEERLLSAAAAAEGLSTHPAAEAIRAACIERLGDLPAPAEDITEEPGVGVKADLLGCRIGVGNERILQQEDRDALKAGDGRGTRVHVTEDGRYIGTIVLSDELKAGVGDTVRKLKENGFVRTLLLTGDGEGPAWAAGEEAGMDEIRYALLPDGKTDAIRELKRDGSVVLFAGDGVNDAPALLEADVGFAMGALGSDAAAVAADALLMTDDPAGLVTAHRIAKKTGRIVRENLAMVILVKAAFLILGALGISSMWMAVLGDVGVMLLAVLNALRMLRQ